MFDAGALLRPWFDRLAEDVPGLALFDAHTHVGANDPDGFSQTIDELLAVLAPVDARALVFPMHEPDGYREANDMVLDRVAVDERHAAGAVPGPAEGPRRGRGGAALPRRRRVRHQAAPARRAVHALRAVGARPRGRARTSATATVLIHAGRGIPALGQDTVHLAEEFPDARLILAHCAISDLSWLWRELPRLPNVFIDTAWWNPSDLIAMFSLCPPANVVWASDSPYGLPLVAACRRCAARSRPG